MSPENRFSPRFVQTEKNLVVMTGTITQWRIPAIIDGDDGDIPEIYNVDMSKVSEFVNYVQNRLIIRPTNDTPRGQYKIVFTLTDNNANKAKIRKENLKIRVIGNLVNNDTNTNLTQIAEGLYFDPQIALVLDSNFIKQLIETFNFISNSNKTD